MENELKRSLMAGPKTFISVNSYVRGDDKRIFCLNGFGRDCRLYVYAEVTNEGYMIGDSGAQLKNGEHFGPGIQLEPGSTQEIGRVVIQRDDRTGFYKCMLKQSIQDATFVGSPYDLRDNPSHELVNVLSTLPPERAEIGLSVYDKRSCQLPSTEGIFQLGFESSSGPFGMFGCILSIE